MTEPLTGTPTDSAHAVSTRVDSAHTGAGVTPSVPPREADGELLLAIAGRHSAESVRQTAAQAAELARHLQAKRRQLALREAEINARLALLENALRVKRMQRSAEEGIPLDQPAPHPGMHGRGSAKAVASPPNPSPSPAASSLGQWFAELMEPAVAPDPAQQSRDQRKEQLDQQAEQLNRMRGQIIEWQRQALEDRIVAEQLCCQLELHLPPKQLAHSIEQLRQRLADHYRLVTQQQIERADELHQREQDLRRREVQLRHQRREVQLWVERRCDELESRLTDLESREQQVARQEADLEDQLLRWQPDPPSHV